MPMSIQIASTRLTGVMQLQPESFEDDRGFFFESYSKREFSRHGFNLDFVQDNHSRSSRGVLRGFHFQDQTAPQWRLVRCTVGTIWDVAVDLRFSSPTFGKWIGVELSAKQRNQLLIPPEFAHGFCVLSDVAEVQYKCTNFHSPNAEKTLAWDDQDVAVAWPISDPTLSERDRRSGMSLKTYSTHPCFA